MILLPDTVYSEFSLKLNSTFNCTSGPYCISDLACGYTINYMEPLSLYIDGSLYIIQPSGFMMDYYNGNEGCSILISSVSDSLGAYVLGDTFMRNFYASFNFHSAPV